MSLSSPSLRSLAATVVVSVLAACGMPESAPMDDQPEETGTPTTDAGLLPNDGGHEDAGATEHDAGVIPEDDAGVVEDAGVVPEPDAGTVPQPDAGVPVDAGVPPTYQNVVLDKSGDPFCGRFGNKYYAYLPDQVAGGGRVLGFSSKDLVHWSPLGEVFNNVGEAYGGQQTVGLWAPEVLEYGGKYYLYYVNVMNNPLDSNVGDKDIVVIESDDPTDFHNGTNRHVLLDGDYAFIDPSPFVDPVTGELFLVFKARGAYGTGTELRVRPMSNPWTFSGPATTVMESQNVPNAGQLEQPQLRRANNKFFLLFSKGLGDEPSYQIVYAWAQSATGPFTYVGALFESDANLSGNVSQKVIAPGSSSVVLDGAGKPWMVYRQKKTTTKTFGDRGVCIDPVAFHPATNSISGTPTKGVTRTGPVPLP